MNPPDKVKVGPHVYRIVRDRAAIDRAGQAMSATLLGHCDRQALEIAVAPDLAGTVTAETVVHELLHAITDLTGLEDRLGDALEEEVVRALSPRLLELLRDNPDLVAYLVKAR